jgi:NAD(P)-dependent dehydrogenase (short-subunit alcohol dehydrogenase family)
MSGQSVLITGASTGIGEASAYHLDSKGYQVFAGVRKQADADRIKSKSSDQLRTVFLDVTDTLSIASAADFVRQELGSEGLYGLVNNAGIAVAAPIEFLPVDDLRKQLEVNVIGQVLVIQAFLPLLRKARGRIINISSIGGRVAAPFLGPYSASKFAFEALSDSLRVELSPWGIHVAIIEPGSISTPIWEKSLAAVDERLEGLSIDLDRYYHPAIARTRSIAKHSAMYGLPAQDVALVVEKALEAPQPKARYVIGKGTRLALLLKALAPTWLRDRYLAKRTGVSEIHPA